MLVLAAVYNCKDENLQRLVPFSDLEQLMKRTINFLSNLAPLSPVMRKDVQILEYAFKQVSNPSQPHSQHSSFATY
jgi:hypothetical protein